VGIGTASPSELIEIEDGNMLFTNTVSNDSRIYFTHTTTANRRSYIGALETTGTGNALVFAPNANGFDAAEAMRIDSSGTVLVGKTSAVGSSTVGHELLAAGTAYHTSAGAALVLNRTTTTGSIVAIKYNNSTVGSISVTGSATAYNTSSDYRLKENITPVQGASDIVKMMRPCTYTFKSDGSWHDGFLAHELQELHPRAVTGEKDAVDEEGNPDYQGVDYSKLTPILTAALQEALNKIDALEARLTALEAI